MFYLCFDESGRGVWCYNMLELGAILDGGRPVCLVVCMVRERMLVLGSCFADVARHGEVDHYSLVVTVKTHSAKRISLPIYCHLMIFFE